MISVGLDVGERSTGCQDIGKSRGAALRTEVCSKMPRSTAMQQAQRQAGCRSNPALCCHLNANALCPRLPPVPLGGWGDAGGPKESVSLGTGGPPLWSPPAIAVIHIHAKKAPSSANLSCFTAILGKDIRLADKSPCLGCFSLPPGV